MIYCENDLCIYQRRGKCTVTTVGIDRSGGCTSCVYPNFSPEVLEKEKQKTLEKLSRK